MQPFINNLFLQSLIIIEDSITRYSVRSCYSYAMLSLCECDSTNLINIFSRQVSLFEDKSMASEVMLRSILCFSARNIRGNSCVKNKPVLYVWNDTVEIIDQLPRCLIRSLPTALCVSCRCRRCMFQRCQLYAQQ